MLGGIIGVREVPAKPRQTLPVTLWELATGDMGKRARSNARDDVGRMGVEKGTGLFLDCGESY
jgi:hypothetical protein